VVLDTPTPALTTIEIEGVSTMADHILFDELPALDLHRLLADIDSAIADHDRKRQEIRLAPWQLILAGMTASAVLFAGGAAFMKLVG
jgi:hypothetical protein